MFKLLPIFYETTTYPTNHAQADTTFPGPCIVNPLSCLYFYRFYCLYQQHREEVIFSAYFMNPSRSTQMQFHLKLWVEENFQGQQKCFSSAEQRDKNIITNGIHTIITHVKCWENMWEKYNNIQQWVWGYTVLFLFILLCAFHFLDKCMYYFYKSKHLTWENI